MVAHMTKKKPPISGCCSGRNSFRSYNNHESYNEVSGQPLDIHPSRPQTVIGLHDNI
jgi:hypothetical protein